MKENNKRMFYLMIYLYCTWLQWFHFGYAWNECTGTNPGYSTSCSRFSCSLPLIQIRKSEKLCTLQPISIPSAYYKRKQEKKCGFYFIIVIATSEFNSQYLVFYSEILESEPKGHLLIQYLFLDLFFLMIFSISMRLFF